jgi:hypothetical protein
LRLDGLADFDAKRQPMRASIPYGIWADFKVLTKSRASGACCAINAPIPRRAGRLVAARKCGQTLGRALARGDRAAIASFWRAASFETLPSLER